jgi:hypothetical protein
MVAVPAPIPFVAPVPELILAIDELLDDQTPPDVASVSVLVVERQIVDGPVIEPTVVPDITVIVWVAIAEPQEFVMV